jgi:hypothetical protein
LLEDEKGDHKRDVNVRNEKGQVRASTLAAQFFFLLFDKSFGSRWQTPLYWACELKSDTGVELAALLVPAQLQLRVLVVLVSDTTLIVGCARALRSDRARRGRQLARRPGTPLVPHRLSSSSAVLASRWE